MGTDEPANAAAAAVRGSHREVQVEFEVEHGPERRLASGDARALP